MGPFLAQCVRRFNRITDITDAKIVVISTHRTYKTVETLQDELRAQGVTGEVVGKVADPHSLGEEDDQGLVVPVRITGNYIEMFLAEYGAVQYVIISDESPSMYLPEQLPRWIETHTEEALQESHVERALELLA